MSTLELRNIINQYTSKADSKVLKIVKAVFESYNEAEIDFHDELPKEVQELLVIGRNQVKQGKVKSHEEVMTKYRQKYNIEV